MSARRPLIVAAAAVAAVGLSACESSQTKSARLEKTGKAEAKTSVVKAGAANAVVKVLSTAVLHSDLGSAAVVELENTGPDAEVRVPLLIDVKDAKGASAYKNDIDGLQPALQQMAFLGKGQKAYWVNDQVLGAAIPKSVDVQVGKEQSTFAATPPKITLGPARLDSDSTGSYATGEIRNESKILQTNVPIFGVALKGGKVVAAGRALIEKLPPAPTKKPITFKIFFIGDAKGAQLEFTTVPTVLKEAP